MLPPGAADLIVKKARAPKPKVIKPSSRPAGGLWFAPASEHGQDARATKAEKRKRERFKNDPKLIAAARELRDRYLEEVNADRLLPAANGKYDVSRQLEAAPSALKVESIPGARLLEAA